MALSVTDSSPDTGNCGIGVDRLPDLDSARLSRPVYPTPPPIGLQYIGRA